MLQKNDIQAVCFDAFGTLVEITDKRRPYLTLLKALRERERDVLRNKLMREPLSLEQCLDQYGRTIPRELKTSLLASLEDELASIRLRPQIVNLWQGIRKRGVKIAVCSNLALPYGEPFLELLPNEPDLTVLSYEVGFIKPEPGIYQCVVDGLDLNPEQILFTGDTQAADVDGPQSFGMQAMLIGELENWLDKSSI